MGRQCKSWCVVQRVVEVSAQLQQSQADFMASQRQLAQLSDQLAATKTKLQSTEKTKTQLTEVCRWLHLHVT